MVTHAKPGYVRCWKAATLVPVSAIRVMPTDHQYGQIQCGPAGVS